MAHFFIFHALLFELNFFRPEFPFKNLDYRYYLLTIYAELQLNYTNRQQFYLH